jgi:hypothetical protein
MGVSSIDEHHLRKFVSFQIEISLEDALLPTHSSRESTAHTVAIMHFVQTLKGDRAAMQSVDAGVGTVPVLSIFTMDSVTLRLRLRLSLTSCRKTEGVGGPQGIWIGADHELCHHTDGVTQH